MNFFARVLSFFMVAFSILATFFGGGVSNDDYDLVVKLNSTPSSGYEWNVEISDKNVLSLEKHTFTSGLDSLVDGMGKDCYGFNIQGNGVCTITFSYIKNGNFDNMKNQVIYTCAVVKGELTVLNIYESNPQTNIAA